MVQKRIAGRFVYRVHLCAILAASLCALAACSAIDVSRLGNQTPDPVTITVWTYYNGPQLAAFNSLIETFNRTEGAEKNIVVESFNHGSVEELQEKVTESVYGKVGADPIPNIFSAYADTAFQTDTMGLLADIAPYLTPGEQARYIDIYLEEGAFREGELKIFPIAKSTELLLLNKTDWEPFAAETGFSFDSLKTMEGVVEAAEAYYEWSGGKAFFGRDAFANYMLIGAMQSGCEIFSVTNGKAQIRFDRAVMRKLWDHYYVPFVKGHFAASGRFRSDDVKTGNILAYVGSSSGATYFPSEVTTADDETHAIELAVLPAPQFAGGKHYAVQQGAGMVVVDTSPEEVEASVCFLKWFTEPERNISFSLGSCYMPVMKEANSLDVITEYTSAQQGVNTEAILRESIQTVNDNTMYTPKAFTSGTTARSILEYSMRDQAEEDRRIVLERIESGIAEEDAMKEFLEDAAFDRWYRQTRARLMMLVE